MSKSEKILIVGPSNAPEYAPVVMEDEEAFAVKIYDRIVILPRTGPSSGQYRVATASESTAFERDYTALVSAVADVDTLVRVFEREVLRAFERAQRAATSLGDSPDRVRPFQTLQAALQKIDATAVQGRRTLTWARR